MAISYTSNNSVRICSFNMHGFNNGVSMTKILCNSFDVILLQEHWLLPSNLSKLGDISHDFTHHSVSAMTTKISEGILYGRPFGGVSILYRNSLTKNISIIDADKEEGRYVTIKLKCVNNEFITVTNVYFPTICAYSDYIVNTSSIMAYLDNLFANEVSCHHVVAGDFNFEYRNDNIGFDLFRSLAVDNNLICCDDLHLNQNIKFTYKHETLPQQSWLDHFFVSAGLTSSIVYCDTIDNGSNLSDHLPICCTINVSLSDSNCTPKLSKVYRDRWDKADLIKYYYQSGIHLQSLTAPPHVTQCSTHCQKAQHLQDINAYYERIIQALKASAIGCVPRMPVNCLKHWWNDDLTRLKNLSIDMHNLWRQVGSPRNGIINEARLKAKLDYKQAIRQAMLDCENKDADIINNKFNQKDSRNFWKCWGAKYRKKVNNTACIDGCTDNSTIANKFKAYFQNTYVDSTCDVNACMEFDKLMSDHSHLQHNDIVEEIRIEDIEKCIELLKPLKSAGHDDVAPEHLIHSHPSLCMHLKLLFGMMLNHNYVPDSFGIGVIIPVVKDKRGNLNSVENYRPITLSPIISKVFESFVLNRFAKFMTCDPLQFGFQRSVGCNNALFAIRQVIQYFNDRDSNVMVASLDACKAFDRVNHFKLFSTLLQRKLPLHIIKVLINWYCKLMVQVRWNNSLSDLFHVKSGVRQGGILSPALFNVYIDCVINKLRASQLGCHIGSLYIAVVLFADDILLLSSSFMELQRMIDLCVESGDEIGLKFNAAKSHCMIIGPHKVPVKPDMMMGNSPTAWSETIKYLGVYIQSDKKFTVDLSLVRRKFFASVNCILRNAAFTSDIVKLELVEKQCFPILLYGLQSFDLKSSVIANVNAWVNSVYRKIFGYHKWESVKECIYLLGRLDVFHTIKLRRINFLKNIQKCNNEVARSLFNYVLHTREFQSCCTLPNNSVINISKSCDNVRKAVFNSFQSKVVGH